MNPTLHREITTRIHRDYAFKKEVKGWLREGVCPVCNKRELFTHAEAPWVIKCGRLNKCGAEFHVKDLYDDLFKNWSELYPVTPENPNASADAYMHDGRGFDLAKVAGWYTQESYYSHELKMGSATVRFALPGVGYWERIIDKPERFGNRKANFNGQYGGTWWVAPGVDLSAPEVKEIWFTEGVFDSTALMHHDYTSASLLTCNNYPEKALKALAEQCAAAGRKRPKLVWALDTGKAGESYTRQWVAKSIEDGWNSTAAQPPIKGKKKLDWNELHQLGRLNDKTIKDSLYRGALLLAKDAREKALLIYNKEEYNSFHFEFDKRMWWFDLNLEKLNKAQEDIAKQSKEELSKDELRNRAMLESHTLREIADCHFTALYFQRRLLTDDSWYYFQVDFPHDGRSVKETFTGKQTTSATEFKNRLRSIAPGATFFGNNGQLDRIMSNQLFNIKTVQTIDFIGYSKEKNHAAWIFNSVAVKNGKMISLNEEDFFELGSTSIKSLNKSCTLEINTDLKEFSTEWFDLLWHCYRHKGMASLAIWLGSLFAEQIRDKYKEFPFAELVGEANAGKSTLIDFLWRLFGRYDYEGFDPRKGTIVGRSRNFMQVSNLPVVLIEGDRNNEEPNKSKQTGFDWEELKPLFNGRGFYTRGVQNGGTDTHEPPFRGSLVISQNSPVQSHEAIMQRIVHIGFDTSMHTPETEISADKLKQFPMEQVSGFILKATLAEKQIMDTLAERIPFYEQRIRNLDGVKNSRIVRNHAKLSALVEALSHVITIGRTEREETLAFIEDMAVERQQSLEVDHKVVQEFWDTFYFLNEHSEATRLNHSSKPDEIAINLNHFVQVAMDMRQQVPLISELKSLLKTSRKHKFIESNRPHFSGIKNKTMRCWIFKADQSKGNP
jgi:hypothetical protein